MKYTVFSSVAIAALTAFVKADSTSNSTDCWMELGQYTTGGAFCVEPLPDFSDESGCMASQATCVQEYNECKADTISASACLTLNTRCQLISTFCTTYCIADSNGNSPCNCNLATVNAWDGVDVLSTDSCSTSTSAAVNNDVASTPIATTAPTVADVPITTAVVASTSAAASTAAASTAAALIAPNVPCGQCFSDPGSGKRAFEQGPNYASSGTRMTIGMCMGICQNAGYKYTGIEYGQECWCGNSFLNGATPASAASCSMTCAGDKTQTCGGDLFMNVYQTGCGAPTTPQSTSASSAAINKYASTAIAQYAVKSSSAAAYNAANNYQAAKSTVAAYAAAAVKTTAAAYNAVNNYQASSSSAAGYNAANNYQAAKSTAAAYVAATTKTTPAAYNAVNNYQASSSSVAAYNAANNYQAAKSTVAAYAAAAVKTTAAAAYAAAATSQANTYVTYTPTVGICSIPTAYATPIGGFHAPIVACNDGSDYATKPWKRYNSHYTSTCPVYYSGWEANACTEACTDQYNSCIADYANTFKTYSSYSAYKVRRADGPEKEKRTWWTSGYGTTTTYGSTSQAATKDTLSSATAKCYAQYSACWTANQHLTSPGGSCAAGGVYHAPSTQAGYSTYNAAAKSYGSYNTNNNAYTSSSSYGGSTTNNNDYWKE